jgi:hypothetical protein
MKDGDLAIGILIILSFIAFILWARTARGRSWLRKTFGEPRSTGKRPRMRKPRAGSRTKATPTSKKRTSR